MGQLINFSERLADRSRPSHGTAAFFFALGCPISYLAAERVERTLGEIEWVPMATIFTEDRSENERRRVAEELLAVAEREAEALRLPLIAPDLPCQDTRAASRAAVWASEQRRGPQFALAVSRLLFAGSFDADDPHVIVESAAAAGLAPDEALTAAADPGYDVILGATARGLKSRGIYASPAIRVGQRWFEGLDAVPGAQSFAAVRSMYGAPAS